MDSAYFDSSIFLAIFNGEPSGPSIKQLLRELRGNKNRVCTSIITVQEVSVASYLAGVGSGDNYAKVERLARIHGMTLGISLRAAELEAELIKRMQGVPKGERKALSQRRKWDCFHIATAIEMHCRSIYSLDIGMLNCRGLISGRHSITFSEPKPSSGEFNFEKGTFIQ